MPGVKFLGRVIPDRGLSITNLPVMSFVYPSGLEGQIAIQIEHSALTIACGLSSYSPGDFEMLHLHVPHISRPVSMWCRSPREMGSRVHDRH
jgi:hypothetical protein